MAISTPNLVMISQISAELWTFSFFQDGGRPPSWILLQIKNDVTACYELSMSTTVSNLVTIFQTAAELLRFSVFQNGGRPPSWILFYPKSDIRGRCGLPMAISRPNVIKISQIAAELWTVSFFKMAAVRHLGFCYRSKMTSRHAADCPYLPPCQIWWQYLKRRPSYCDFPFFNTAAAAILDFVGFYFQTTHEVYLMTWS